MKEQNLKFHMKTVLFLMVLFAMAHIANSQSAYGDDPDELSLEDPNELGEVEITTNNDSYDSYSNIMWFNSMMYTSQTGNNDYLPEEDYTNTSSWDTYGNVYDNTTSTSTDNTSNSGGSTIEIKDSSDLTKAVNYDFGYVQDPKLKIPFAITSLEPNGIVLTVPPMESLIVGMPETDLSGLVDDYNASLPDSIEPITASSVYVLNIFLMDSWSETIYSDVEGFNTWVAQYINKSLTDIGAERVVVKRFAKTWFLDNDGDGYHSETVISEGVPENGNWKSRTLGEDCDDNNPHKTKLVNDVCLDECDLARASLEVYHTENNYKEHNVFDTSFQNGWNLARQDELPFVGTNFKFTHVNSGFNSALYVRVENGIKQFLYVTEGTDPNEFEDVYTDFDQLFRSTAQHMVSVQNARILHDLVAQEGGVLFFAGHSLGGGLASANALATGNHAFTYNSAGLSQSIINDLNLNKDFESNVEATIVYGELLNTIQTRLKDIRTYGNINYIDGEDITHIKFYDNLTKEYQEKYEQALSDLNLKEAYGFGKEYVKNKYNWGYSKYKAHLMETVLETLKCPE